LSDTLSDVSDLDTAINSTSTKLPQVSQHNSVWDDFDTSGSSTSPSPSPTTDESTALSLTVLWQHHASMEETLSTRLTLLRNASNMVARNGGYPNGIPFALEYSITHGDVTVIVDIAKVTYSITDDGGDCGDERGDMDIADYLWVTAWLSAVPMMIAATNVDHVLVGLKVLTIMLPILEQWVDTAIGIAHSIGSQAIPDELYVKGGGGVVVIFLLDDNIYLSTGENSATNTMKAANISSNKLTDWKGRDVLEW
jgi:hypothetical protein